MHDANLSKLFITGLALSLTACSSSSSDNDKTKDSGHNVIIGMQIPGGPSFKGSGKWTTVQRKVEQFHAIELKDVAKVQVAVGMPLAVSVQTDDNLVDVIDTKVVGGKLVISINKSFQTYRAPEVTISVPELSEVDITGSGDVTVNAIKGDVFNVDIKGSGTFSGTGKVISEKIDVSGSGNVDCAKVQADNVTVDVSGSGNCMVDAGKSLKAKMSGSGNIKYKGNPASLNKDVTGAGAITQI